MLHENPFLYMQGAGLSDGMCDSDVILPVQFFQKSSLTDLIGEKRLILAVLEEALHTFLRYCSTSGRKQERRLFEEAKEWLWDDDETYPFSFWNICKELKLDHSHIRGGLQKWLKDQATKTQKNSIAVPSTSKISRAHRGRGPQKIR